MLRHPKFITTMTITPSNSNHKKLNRQDLQCTHIYTHVNTSTHTHMHTHQHKHPQTHAAPLLSVFSLLWQGWEWQLENHSASEPGWSGVQPQWRMGLSDPLKTDNQTWHDMTTDRKLQTWCQSQAANIRFWNIHFDGNSQICSPKTALENIQFLAFLSY